MNFIRIVKQFTNLLVEESQVSKISNFFYDVLFLVVLAGLESTEKSVPQSDATADWRTVLLF